MHTLCSFRATFACSAAALALAALGSATCHAQGRGNPPPPPPEAHTACTGQTEGASVTLTMPDGKTLTGTCRVHGGQLAAVPSEGPGAGGPPPPRQD